HGLLWGLNAKFRTKIIIKRISLFSYLDLYRVLNKIFYRGSFIVGGGFLSGKKELPLLRIITNTGGSRSYLNYGQVC
ncbi:MAG: hypothetical protein ACI8WB_002784, partial [Phenylobacterium sp.]